MSSIRINISDDPKAEEIVALIFGMAQTGGRAAVLGWLVPGATPRNSVATLTPVAKSGVP